MRKKKFAATAVALVMTAITVFSVGNTPSVKAADVADKSAIDLEINGSYEEKKISTADSDVINKAFGYDSGTNSVLVCGENSKGYIDWNKSSIPHWKVYQTEVFTPVLSRDTEGNLVVKTDSNGKLATKENGLYGKQTVYARYDDPSTFVYKISWGDNHFSPSQGGNKSDDGKYYYADNEINLNMGLKTYEFAAYDGLTYLGKQTQNIEDVYIVRVCYTADDKMNYTYTSSLQDRGEGGYDINGNYVDFSSDDAWAEYNKDRTLRYIDFWILPEGVSTVLNFEDETPAPSPSEDNYTVDLGDSQIVSADTFATILAENATKDVIIKSNNNVTFTFAKGTMASVDGKTEYDFSTSINSVYADTMPSYITKDNFVSQINFNYSGKLPGTANIRFYAGTEYAGQTLYYSLMNADNTFAEVQAVVVDADGYMTVKQDHCSSYVVTKTEPKLPSNDDTKTDDGNNSNNGGSSDNGNTSNNGNASASDNNTSSGNTTVSTDNNTSSANTTATSPKTGDMTPIAIYVVIAVAAMGVIVFVKRRKTA